MYEVESILAMKSSASGNSTDIQIKPRDSSKSNGKAILFNSLHGSLRKI